MADVIAFPKTPIRALVVIPAAEPHLDLCRVVPGGYGFEGPTHYRGRLETVLRRLHSEGRGLPITVHSECRRRAGQ